jgi:tetratricopeptide (TPR) repeat protein
MGVAYQQSHEPDSAIMYFNKAIDAGISENISNYYTQLASTYEELKDFKSAIKYYKAAYESSRADILLYHLARNYDVYYKDKTQAIAYYKRF